jgi:hypothetical protein
MCLFKKMMDKCLELGYKWMGLPRTLIIWRSRPYSFLLALSLFAVAVVGGVVVWALIVSTLPRPIPRLMLPLPVPNDTNPLVDLFVH